MKRTGSVLFAVVVLLMLMTPAAGLLRAPAREEGVSLDAYIEENVALRAPLITLHAVRCRLLWGQSGNAQVISGRDGWLYYQDTLADTLRRDRMDDQEIERLAGMLSALSQGLQMQGVRFTFVCAPNKSTIYPEQLPYYLQPLAAESNLDRLLSVLSVLGVDALDLRAPLLEAKASAPQYYRTDTHWNAAGALTAYRALMAHLAQGTGSAYDAYGDVTWETSPLLGDLSAMMLPLATQSEREERPVLPRAYAVDGIMRSTSDMLIRTHSEANDLRVLMLRDSFGDNLFSYLANNVGLLVYTRQLSLDMAMIEGDAIGHVVLEVVERNLPALLNDFPALQAP